MNTKNAAPTIRNSVQYKCMTTTLAGGIFCKFEEDFGDGLPATETEESRIAMNLYGIALVWAIDNNHIERFGIDPEFAADCRAGFPSLRPGPAASRGGGK